MTKVICWQRNLNPAFFLSENAEYDEEINEKEKEGGKIKKWTEATQPWLLRSQQDLTWADTWPSSSRHMVFPPDASSSKISWWWNRPPSAFQHPSTNKNLKQLQKLQNWTNDALGLGKPTSSKTDEFSEIHDRSNVFLTSSIMAKKCNINFWIEWSPPPFGTFKKILKISTQSMR